MDCNDLATHVSKRHFSYSTAFEMYHIQCSDPLKLEFASDDIHQTPETWTKSDESGYGLQYER